MAKWKVLIADDEFIIRDGIRSSVNWSDYGMEVMAEAEDGEEAIELALEHKIDILLIDINMPIMNGISAMKRIKEELPECRMVVISGYDDFRYAQEAIRLQVEDYLLKPVNPNKLEEILVKTKQQLEMKKQEEDYLHQASSQVEKNHEQLRQRFFLDWIEGRLEESEVAGQLQFLNLPHDPPTSFIMLKWAEGEAEHNLLEEADRQQQLQAIKDVLSEIMAEHLHAIFIEDVHFITVFLWKAIRYDIAIEIEEQVMERLEQRIYSKYISLDPTNITVQYKETKQELNQYMRLSPLVKQSLQYIRKHYRDPHMTLEAIAASLHVSTVYLSKMIKQELGKSYVQILTHMRLRAAKELLQTTDLSIREVAERVGYDSQHYFSTAFRKSVGITPKQYKQQSL
ncbi:response regulator [Gracilibacillus kekensis]|uniref:Two component transcriptional regulator, AraC family n=1 Tax=Gracilibacillus kekensis TaxID=1027249 RepID=A0A1M7QI13_9BACI|nr:response regulator [Gracilibacillus kekensis]SHN30819.1 two component transcriptional regulator, AraC family [Gracilibacillus kekensis]